MLCHGQIFFEDREWCTRQPDLLVLTISNSHGLLKRKAACRIHQAAMMAYAEFEDTGLVNASFIQF